MVVVVKDLAGQGQDLSHVDGGKYSQNSEFV
jgi:hypothetical protein